MRLRLAIATIAIFVVGCASSSDITELRTQIDSLETALDAAAEEIAGVTALLHATEGALADVLADVAELREFALDVDAQLKRTRLWVGDLAHCLVYEADTRRYIYWEATPFESFGSWNHRGEWGFGVNPSTASQVSHCER